MKLLHKILSPKIIALLTASFLSAQVYAAADQILNDNFFPDPAELSLIHKAQIIGGGMYLLPRFNYTGITFGNSGTVGSKATDLLPYLLSAYRINDKTVFGINITPSGYGHLDWPLDSFVSNATTLTYNIYYRIGAQSSYQWSEQLALGLGLNFEWFKELQLNHVVPGLGNEVNRVSGKNFSADLGILYKLNAKNYLIAAAYTPIKMQGVGTSTLGSITNSDFSLTMTAAPVIYIGSQHFITDKWFLEDKIYWSGWTIQKNLTFSNSVIGTYVVPTNWRDVITLQLLTRYALMDKLALLGSIAFESNAVPLSTNAVGYPLAASGAVGGGLDVALNKDFSVQGIYAYGAFIPNSPIDNMASHGMVHAYFQTVVVQFIYKI